MNDISVNFDRARCLCCAGCVSVCPKNALYFTNMRTEVDSEKCVECRICAMFCPVGAISLEKAKING